MNKLTKTLSLTTVAIGLAMGSLAIANTEEIETVKAETNQTYTVQSGDNLYRIAVNNGMDVYDLAELKQVAALSGKKWDASMKNLSKHNLIKISVNGDTKTIDYLG